MRSSRFEVVAGVSGDYSHITCDSHVVWYVSNHCNVLTLEEAAA
jgi:hypothetical protein